METERIWKLSMEYPPHGRGGLATHVRELAEGLARRGAETHVIVRGWEPLRTAEVPAVHNLAVSSIPPTDELIRHADVRAAGLQPEGNEFGATNAAAMDHCRAMLDRLHEPTIIHQYDYHFTATAVQLAAQCKADHVLTVALAIGIMFADSAGDGWTDPIWEVVRQIEQGACLCAGRVIVASGAMREAVQAHYGVPDAKIRVVHNGLAIDRFRGWAGSAADAARLRTDLGLDGRRLVLFAGRIQAQKGVHELIQAAASVCRTHPDVTFLIIGPDGVIPDYAARARSMIAELGFSDVQMRMLPPMDRSDLPRLLNLAAVVAVPSVHEPFGYAALEASCLGKPVVASRVGGLQEVVEDGRTGVLVDVDRVSDTLQRVRISDLAAAIVTLLGDEALAAQMGAAGARRAEERFSVEAMVRGHVRVYQELAAERALAR